MIKHLRKVGNSTALLLDKPILELLGLKDRDAVQITVSSGSLIVTPMNPAPSQDDFEACVERVIKRRRKLLQRLSQ
jgi:antitoxin component of MazEF toxin-antitoxin module